MAWQPLTSEAVVAKDKDKDKKSKTAIYHPPKSGMPYLVVTISAEGISATAVDSKDEARVLASKKTLKVLVRDGANDTPAQNS